MHDDPVSERAPLAHAPGDLALDLTSEAVRLVARDADSAWVELASARLGDDFRAGIEALRRVAEAQGSSSLTLLLPPDQILVRRYVLGRRGSDEALARIAADTGHPAGDLVIALSPAGEGELVTVLAAFRCTVNEALEYARRWGFEPVAVSTMVEAGRFGAAGPLFQPAKPAPRRSGRVAALAAAAALLAVGLGILGAREVLPVADLGTDHAAGSGRPAPARMAATPGEPAATGDRGMAAVADAPGSVDPVRPQEPESMRTAQAGQPKDLSKDPSADSPSLAGPILHRRPATAATDRPLRLELGPDSPALEPWRHRFLQPAAPPAAADLAPLLAGLERIRAESLGAENLGAESLVEGLHEEQDAVSDAVFTTASAMAPERVHLPVPRPSAGDAALSGELAEEAEGSDTPPPFDGGSDSLLAVLSAPPPPARPSPALRSGAAAVASAAAPQLGAPAGRTGLSLDATSMIGVIDARSGREALLRMPTGDFLRVSRGDQVAGWRVSIIGQDAMRLTRGDQTRTLLLVTR